MTHGVSPVVQVGQRFTYDQSDLMGYPFATVGNKLEAFFDESDKTRGITYPAIDWRIEQPKELTGKIPSVLLYDVYFGLMFLWSLEGFPDHGEIRFSRYNFLQMIGWVSNGRSAAGGKRTTPSGRHYRQLLEAMKALHKTSFTQQNDQTSEGEGFSILQHYKLKADQPGRKAEGIDLPKNSLAIFSKPFVEKLKAGASAIKMDLDLYLSLSTGMPRVLFRTLSWMRWSGVNSIPIEVLFQRIGSIRQRYIPAVAKQTFDAAHDELRTLGFLAAEPDFEKIDDVWHVTYQFGDPVALRSEEDALVREAENYGVSLPVARELAVAHRERFRQVMAAVSSGRLKADRNIAGMIVSYTRHVDYALPIDQPRTPRLMSVGEVEILYQTWLREEQERRLRDRPDISLAALRSEILENCAAQNLGEVEEWYIEGMIRARLSALFGLPSLQEFRNRMERGEIA